MGVGVYSSDFNGTGDTFLVSGPLAEDENYQVYVDSVVSDNPNLILEQDGDEWYFRDKKAEGEDASVRHGPHDSKEAAVEAASQILDFHFMDKDEWGRFEYDDFNERMIECLEDAGRELGMTVIERQGRFRNDRAGFDDEFVGILDSRIIQVGWRSWETDFVIGVGADKAGDFQDMLGEPGNYASEIMREFGRTPDAFADKYSDIMNKVSEYMRLSLMTEDMECRFRTSGYTSGRYETPENVSERMDELASEIKAGIEWLEMSPEEAASTMDERERISFLRALHQLYESDSHEFNQTFSVSVPVYNHNGKNILYADMGGKIVAAGVSDHLQIDFRNAEQVEGLSVIPFNADTKDWFAKRQATRSTKLGFVASAEEVALASGEDYQIRYDRVMDESFDVLTDTVRLGDESTPQEREAVLQRAKFLVPEMEARTDLPEAYRQALKDVVTLLESDPDAKDKAELLDRINYGIEVDIPEDPNNDDAVTLTKARKPSLKL